MANAEVLSRFKEPKSVLVGFLIGSLLAVLVWFASVQAFGGSPSSDPQYSFQPVDESSVAQELESLEDFELSFSGTSSLYKAISTKDKNDLLTWLEESIHVESLEHRRAIQIAILERMAELDPIDALQHALELPRADQVVAVESVFGVWSITDLDSAVASGLDLDRITRYSALEAILKTRGELTEGVQLEIATLYDSVHLVSKLRNERIVRERGGNPGHAWNTILNDSSSLISKAGLLADLAGDWRRHDSKGIVEKIVASVNPGVDAWSSEKYVFLTYIVKVLAKFNPQEIFEQTADLSDPSREALLRAVAEEWAQSSPAIAFEKVSSYEQNLGHKDLTSSVANTWAKSDPQALIANMETQSADLKLLGMEQAVLALLQSSPEDAIDLMDELASEGLNISMIESTLVKEWSIQDPRSATSWVQSSKERFGPAAVDLLQIALGNLAPLDPELAMDLAQQNPPESGRRALDLEVVLSLARTNIEAAEALLPRISLQSRLVAVKDMANHLVSNDDHQRALQLASHVPDGQRTSIYLSVLTKWARNNPLQLMEELERLPTPAVSEIAANQLVKMHVGNPLLSSQQLEYVKSFMGQD